MGSMIYKKRKNDGKIETKISLVDGQQRLTTILLLIRAIADVNKDVKINKFIYSSQYNTTGRLKFYRRKSEHILNKILKGDDNIDKDNLYYKNY
jgi:uncharacterized protein with ParB-like and HNH nuclease domain